LLDYLVEDIEFHVEQIGIEFLGKCLFAY